MPPANTNSSAAAGAAAAAASAMPAPDMGVSAADMRAGSRKVCELRAAKESAGAASPKGGDRVRIRIGQYWYDLTAWQNMHPGGATILKQMSGKDATDAFTAIHSDEAVARLERMGRTPVTAEDEAAHVSRETLAFRAFRSKLVEEGWWQREPLSEMYYILMVWGLVALGTYLACYTSQRLLAIGVLGLAMQQAGWLGHDYQHGRGDFCWWVGAATAGLINGFSPRWWSDKHNTHHVFPNFHGLDQDIANDPILHLWTPSKDRDHACRKWQHWYFLPICGLIYVSWRIQSFQWAKAARNYWELSLMAINYAWLIVFMPWTVSIGAIVLGGLFVGVVVTATHQSEQFTTELEEPQYNWVKHQFDSTRDADTTGLGLMEYFWGGMQYQLEHHLFPTMPRYKYPALSRRVRAFAVETGLDYRSENVWAIWRRTLSTMQHFGLSPAL